MVKILHLADIHLGMENYGKTDKSGINSRLLDFLESFDYAVDYAIKEKVEFFLFAGDAFKSREPTQTQQREFAKRIKKLSQENIKVILVIGNHDLPNAYGKADTLEIYKTLEVENVYISKDPEIFKFRKMGDRQWELGNQIETPGFANECFQIATLPWITRSSLVGKEGYQNKNIEEVNIMVGEKISQTIKELAGNIDPNYPAVMIAHATVAGAEFGAERKVYVGSDIVLSLNNFVKPWKYTALGHLHKFQVLSQDPPVIYSGSIDRVDFSEEKEDKGFVIAEIEKNSKTKYSFIKIPARKFISIDVDIRSDAMDPIEIIKKEINKNNLENAVVKVNIKVPEDLAVHIDNREVSKYLDNAYHIASINKEIIKNEKIKAEMKDIESFTPIMALDKYLSISGVKEDKLKDYKSYAEKLINNIEE